MVEYYTTFERKLYCAVRFSWIFHIKLILICSFRKCYSLFCISYGFWFTHSTSMLRATICLTKRMLNNSMLSLASVQWKAYTKHFSVFICFPAILISAQFDLLLWSMNQLYPFNFDLRNDWSKAFVFLNTCWGDYLWTIFRTQLEIEPRGIFFLNVKLAFMSLFCPLIPWLLNFFNILNEWLFNFLVFDSLDLWKDGTMRMWPAH